MGSAVGQLCFDAQTNNAVIDHNPAHLPLIRFTENSWQCSRGTDTGPDCYLEYKYQPSPSCLFLILQFITFNEIM